MKVAPLVGAWIEIYVDLDAAKDGYGVAPLVGAWIEIDHKGYYCSTCAVAPLVGAWIEICWDNIHVHPPARSLPSWERGLKYICCRHYVPCTAVAPLVGAWIEISSRMP